MKSQKIISLNPSKNYEIIGEIFISQNAEIAQKVLQARTAFEKWSQLSIVERIFFLEKLYKKFVERKKELIAIISQEVGMPVAVCEQVDVGFGLQYLRPYTVGS